jgi:hypothetical protein
MRKISKITAIFPGILKTLPAFGQNFKKKHGGNHFAKTTYLATNFYEDDTLFQNSCFSLLKFRGLFSVLFFWKSRMIFGYRAREFVSAIH